MKKVLCLTAVALALTLGTPAIAQTTTMPMHHEHHPEIHHAMHALENAKTDLEKAKHDFGGHRTKALEHVNAALDELKQALAYREEEHHEHH